MGYACPVCETPQSDAEHLANHLAFTAMLGDDDHEAWLDDHAPGWSEQGETELAARVEEYAKEVGFPQVFEDTTPRHNHHDHGHHHEQHGDRFEDELARANTRGRGSMASSPGAASGETKAILREAQEMTRQMVEGEENEDGEDSEDGEETTGE